MRREIRFQEVVEGATSHGFFQQTQEEVPLVVGNGGHAVVGIAVLQVQTQVGVVGVHVHDGVHLVHQPLVAQCAQHLADVAAIDCLHDALFEVHGEAFVEPEIVPRGVGDQVATPTVGQFVGHERHQASVARNDGGRGECESWIFHASEREGGRKDQEVVAFPSVFAVQVFGGHQHVLHLGEFELCGVDQIRRCVHSGVRTDLAEFHVSHRQGQEVGRDGLVHAERVDAVVRFGGGVHSAHQRHQLLGDPNGRVVREPNAGAVLAGHPCSGQNGLALREQEGALTLNPQEGVCLIGRAVGHSHLFRC